jgi:hypothetical protein
VRVVDKILHAKARRRADPESSEKPVDHEEISKDGDSMEEAGFSDDSDDDNLSVDTDVDSSCDEYEKSFGGRSQRMSGTQTKRMRPPQPRNRQPQATTRTVLMWNQLLMQTQRMSLCRGRSEEHM